MPSIWDSYPSDYRAQEVKKITAAVRAGECVSVVGLSGAGKSNLLGFIAGRVVLPDPGPRFVLIDCNRLAGAGPAAFYRLARRALESSEAGEAAEGGIGPEDAELASLDRALAGLLAERNLCLLLDRFDALTPSLPISAQAALFSNLRALRDAHKYALTYVTGTRRPLDPVTELAELFYANTLWLGPLSESDARWTIARYAQRKGLDWDETQAQALVRLAATYPSLLRAACEAFGAGAGLDLESLRAHPAVQRRVAEFWEDAPDPADLARSGLTGHPFLPASPQGTARTAGVDESSLASTLTAKEHLLLEYLRAHPGQVCAKDDLIRAVWPEDRIFEEGVRDDSLAQLVRRLRKKIEPDPSLPRYLHTVPGRGYRFSPN
jgi:energy-coupling factor transporter ATP-binding protein EcfA2